MKITDYKIRSTGIFRGVIITLNLIIGAILLAELTVDLKATTNLLIIPLSTLCFVFTVFFYYNPNHPISRIMVVVIIFLLIELHFVFNPSIYHVIIYWMPFIPLIALIVNGIRACIYWAAGIILVNFGNYILLKFQIGDAYEVNVTSESFLVTSIIFLLSIISSSVLLYYLLGKAYDRSNHSNQKLLKVREKIELKNQEIEKVNFELNDLNKNLESIVQKRTNALLESNDQLKEYAYINSHLLRAPLAKIMTISNLLDRGDEFSPELRELLVASSKELDEIIREISELVHKE